jgi:eukaryotic-like serine/threonine-protein kinase
VRAFPRPIKTGSLDAYGRLELRRVDVVGGAQSTVCDLAKPIRGSAWSADGQILIGTPDGLFRVPASGGTPAPLTTLDPSRGERAHMWPQALPRSRFLYFAASDRPEHTGIYAASLAKPADRVHLLAINTNTLYAPVGDGKDYLVWRRAGALVAQEFDAAALKMLGEPHEIASPARVTALNVLIAAVSANGSLLYSAAGSLSLLSWFDRKVKSLETVGEPAEYLTFRLSPDGRRIAASRSQLNGSNEIWILESSRGAAIRFAEADIAGLAAWSPDGRAVVYASPNGNLLRQELAGSGNTQLLTPPGVQFPNDWSRDGRLILYSEFVPDKNFDLKVLEIGSDGKPASSRSWLTTPYQESDGRFSPEARPRWVAYQSGETGRLEIYIDSFPEHRKKIRVSIDGGRFVQWRADGRELFFLVSRLQIDGGGRQAGSGFGRDIGAARVVRSAYRGKHGPALRSRAGRPALPGARRGATVPAADADCQLARAAEGVGGAITRVILAYSSRSAFTIDRSGRMDIGFGLNSGTPFRTGAAVWSLPRDCRTRVEITCPSVCRCVLAMSLAA